MTRSRGIGRGGLREYRKCEGAGLWPSEIYAASPMTRNKLTGKCPVCGKIMYLTDKWNIKIHKPLHVTVQMWEQEAGEGGYTDQDEGSEIALPEDS